MIVEATTPSRVDLAGGTLDIWPLYLLLGGGITVNCALSMGSYVRLSTRRDRKIRIHSEDTGERLSAPDVDSLALGGRLDLPARLVKFYRPPRGLDVVTRNDAPHGSGLGASSSLIIALSGALCRLSGKRLAKQKTVDNAANLEAQLINIPTGKQDYYPAMYGGINAIWFEVDGDRVEHLKFTAADYSALEDRITLSFTGVSHFSGASNWAMLKNYIDGRGRTRANLHHIKETSLKMRTALVDKNWDALGKLLGQEWRNRARLAKGVSTARIERLMAAARSAGAEASKLCGAGGGGCMVTYSAPEDRKAVQCALAGAGARILPFKVARKGLTVKVVR